MTADEAIKLTIGSLVVENSILKEQVENLTEQVKQLTEEKERGET